MFLYSLYKSPLFNSLEPRDRLLRIMVGAVILYILLRSYLYSGYAEGHQWLCNWRHYVYYVILLDLVATSLFYLFGGNSKPKIKKAKRKNLPFPPYMMPQQMQRLQPRSVMRQEQMAGATQQPQQPVKTPVPNTVRSASQPIMQTKPKEQLISQSEDTDIPLYHHTKEEVPKEDAGTADVESMPVYGTKLSSLNDNNLANTGGKKSQPDVDVVTVDAESMDDDNDIPMFTARQG